MTGTADPAGLLGSWLLPRPASALASAAPVLVVAAAALLAWYLYRRALPRPLPDIPYNRGVGVLGDFPAIMALRKSKREWRHWLGDMADHHGSAIWQFFPMPFTGSPAVVLTDYRECHDLLLRRSKEFDRSRRDCRVFGTVIPDHHIAMQSADPRFRASKELVKDLMTPAFLHQVSAPAIYDKARLLVDMWALKARLAGGRPFAAFHDVHEAAMDIILAVSFGFADEDSMSRRQLDALAARAAEINASSASASASDKKSPGADEPFDFPRVEPPADVRAMLTVTASLHVSLASPFPSLHHGLLRRTRWRRDFAAKERFVTDEVAKAVARLAAGGNDEGATRCAMDNMILREIAAAKKADRPPVFNTPRMRDELFGYIIGGHDTSSTTLAWIVKFLADNPGPQARLRRQLRRAWPAAAGEGRQPTAAEIVSVGGAHAAVPYLDAFVEESLRVCKTLPMALREATTDTTLLGRRIPKGTPVFMFTRGASFSRPAIPVPEAARSESSRAARGRVGEWDDETIGRFMPERWLKPTEGGTSATTPTTTTTTTATTTTTTTTPGGEEKEKDEEEDEFAGLEFDPQAGPLLAFGGGPRGCFGRRLAYLELRIVTALLVWNFEFGDCGPALSSYDGVDVLTTTPTQCYVRLKSVA